MTEPFRCTVCGNKNLQMRPVTSLDPQYATVHCPSCGVDRTAVRAATINEATEGYRKLLAEREAKAAERRMMKGGRRFRERTE